MAHDIVVLGGSVGALQALREMLRGLPGGFAASVFVVIHTSPDTPGMLPTLLERCTDMHVAYARDGEPIESRRVYVAPPDHHLLLYGDHVRITRGPRENNFRPAADPLFRTAAAAFGARVIGVVLSGGLDDGTRGLAAIKTAGGLAVVQQVDDAVASGMPMSAIRNVEVDHVVPAAALAALLHRLVTAPTAEKDVAMKSETAPPDRAERGLHALEDGTYEGPPSAFTCPECGGALWEVANRSLARYACHVGHSYSPDTLANSMAATLEAALWTALRALEENGAFLRRMEARATTQGLASIAEGYAAKARDSESRAEIVRSALVEEMRPDPAAAAAVTPPSGETS